MKKIIAVLLALCLVFAVSAFAEESESTPAFRMTEENSVLYVSPDFGYSLRVPDWLTACTEEENAANLAYQQQFEERKLYENRTWYLQTAEMYAELDAEIMEPSFASFDEEIAMAFLEAENNNQAGLAYGDNSRYELLFDPYLIQIPAGEMLLHGLKMTQADGTVYITVNMNCYTGGAEFGIALWVQGDAEVQDVLDLLTAVAVTLTLPAAE